MERHLRRTHYLDPQSLLFPSQYEINHAPKFNADSPKYFRSSSIFHDSPDFFSGRSAYLQDRSAYSENSFPSNPHNAFDRPLEMLRKAVEFKKLRQELSSTVIQQPYHMAFNGFVYQADTALTSQPSVRFEDLEIMRYVGYVCRECLVAHPLAVYRHKYSPAVKPIPTVHACVNERILEVQQQKNNNEPVVANLYSNELPELMLRYVRGWTRGQAILLTTEIPALFDSRHELLISSQKQWAIHAIRDGSAILTDDELLDFIDIVRNDTWACIKIDDIQLKEYTGRTYFMAVCSGHDLRTYPVPNPR